MSTSSFSTRGLDFCCAILTHQRPLKAGGIVETSTHNQERPLLVELVGDGLDLLVQRQHLVNQVWWGRKIQMFFSKPIDKLSEKPQVENSHWLVFVWTDLVES